jgi:hypothetical protein
LNLTVFFFTYQAPQVQAPASTEAPAALTGEDMELTSAEAGETSSEEDKGIRRLDTEPDLLEEFLEEQGKILRLPVDTNEEIPNINDLMEVRFVKLIFKNETINAECFTVASGRHQTAKHQMLRPAEAHRWKLG